jgi:hypothetical protein
MYDPVLALCLMYLDFSCGEVNCDVSVKTVIIQEVLLDDIALITQSQEKLFEAIMPIVLHDMPKYWVVAHLYHGLWSQDGFFT